MHEDVKVLGGTHILFRDTALCRVVCPLPDLQCWEAGDPGCRVYKVGGCLVTRETFEAIITYLDERG
jgi:hypothetical protein